MTEPSAAAPTGSAPSRAAQPRPLRRAAITNLGCKVNQAEMDAVERLLRAHGVEIAENGAAADLHLVNTCTVTAIADDKSRKAVRRARRANPAATVIVTGCSVAVGGAALAAVDPAARLIANEEKDGLLAEVERLLGAATLPGDGPHGPLDAALPTLAGVEIERIADGRSRIDRTRAYVKVQDGCSFFCTYCIIPRARGAERSLEPEVVLADVRRALAAGHREIVLTGINVGTYDGGRSERGPRGAHLRAALTLPGLVRRMLAETSVERIRLSSIEPQHVDDDLLAAWTGESAGRCLPHLHLPLQSGDDGVLRRMGRRYTSADYARIVEWVRAAIPGAAIHADIIAGFPTEDDAAFARSLAFLRSLDPAGLHVFRYSARPGTPAARMAGQVPEVIRRERAAVLLGEAAACRRRFAARAAGERRTVLFEEPADRADPGAGWVGHAEDYVVVRAAAPARGSLAGEIAIVRVDGTDPADPERAVAQIEHVVARLDAGRALLVVPLPA
ncbi:MAG TPA: tRNA (N(6)-L-threonylcarbamoyladenosine(37)-C(2))-methylthiotransferase MtaB [Candidatus Nanopelagicales bacterium]|nr:tRNA (N(6)-L-threonylcarbamoyladenosine(37)-C(2))-methylthiotransferase MtaB [Candidatus Nanopelagicales bacterium]